MESKIHKRFARKMQRVVAEILQREVQPLFKDTIIALHHVIVSKDFSIVKVYISTYPEEKVEEVLAYLNYYENNIALRRKIARRIRHSVRRIPLFKFFEDDTLKEQRKVDALFEQLEKGAIPPFELY